MWSAFLSRYTAALWCLGQSYQTILSSGLGGGADINSEGLVSEGGGGELHGKHLVELQRVLSLWAACAEQAACGLRAGQHYHPDVPADRNEVDTVCNAHLCREWTIIWSYVTLENIKITLFLKKNFFTKNIYLI